MLVADGSMFGSGACVVLRREPDFDVSEAATFEDAIATADELHPDVVLLDHEFLVSGTRRLELLIERAGANVIVWSDEPSPDDVLEAIRAGASGYLHKSIAPAGLLRAFRGIVRGEAPLSRHLTALMVASVQRIEAQARAQEATAALSRRERAVLELLATGAANREIASTLLISEFTVKRHVQNILGKLELPSRHAAASLWAAAGRIDDDAASAPAAEAPA